VEEQGPVNCALRVPLFLSEFPSVNSLIMCGICGGTQLGRVIVARKALALDLGRTKWDSSVQDYVDDHEIDNHTAGANAADVLVSSVVRQLSGSFSRSTLALDLNNGTQIRMDVAEQQGLKLECPNTHIVVSNGAMLSVTKVRDDAFGLLQKYGPKLCRPDDIPDMPVGVEMESYPFFALSAFYNVRTIAVVKGTSDAGWESFDPSKSGATIADHNLAQMRLVEPSFNWKDSNGKPVSNTDARRKYRRIAGQNAAIVTWKLVQEWLKSKGENI